MTNNEPQNNNKPEAAEGIDIEELAKKFWKSFKHYWWLTVIFTVVFAVIGFGYSRYTYRPAYSTTVRFTVAPLLSSGSVNGATSYGLNTNTSVATQMANTFPYIIGSGLLNDLIRYDVGYSYNYNVSTAAPGANLFEVTVSAQNAEFAYKTAVSIVKNYPRVANYIIGDVHMQVLEGSEPKVATEPYNQNAFWRYIGIGALAGVVLGLGICLLIAYFRKSFTDRTVVEKQYGLPYLCSVPIETVKRTGSVKTILKIGQTSSEFAEAFRELKQRLNGSITRNGYKTVGVTSSIADEGKTTVAFNLAKSFSTTYKKVLLVDMSLDSRDIQTLVNRKMTVPNKGITDVVTGKCTLDDVVYSLSGSFDVLFAGESTISFSGKHFSPIFDVLRNHYDVIIVDMPPVEANSDTLPIADLCDGLVLTINWDETSNTKVSGAIKSLAFTRAVPIGFVFNRVDLMATGYLAGSYYSSYRYGRYARYKKYRKYSTYFSNPIEKRADLEKAGVPETADAEK